MPGIAAGKTTFLTVCQRVAPIANDALLYSSGTAIKASSEALIIVGNITIPKVIEPDNMETPKPRNFTKIAKPNKPKTTEGTPARLFTPILITLTSLPFLAYSVKNIAANTPRGAANIIDPRIK